MSGVFLVAHADERGLEESDNGGGDLAAAQAGRSQVAPHAGAQSGQRAGEFEHPAVLAPVAHFTPARVVAVLFAPAYRLVQRLLGAKRDLALDRELKRLDAYDAVILDDLGYVQQDREEMEVLFTFLSQRYERRSVLITSNLVFSQWDKIFKDPMTTAAAIDRVVHHAQIIEMTGPSHRDEEAKARAAANKKEDA